MTMPSKGRWQVTTETSVYLLDLDARLVTRVPDAGVGALPGLPPVGFAALRRDHEAVPLIELIHCEIGRPLRLLLNIRGDGIPTLRTSTYVRQLERLASDDDACA